MVDKVADKAVVAADKVAQQVPVEFAHPVAIVAEADHDRAT